MKKESQNRSRGFTLVELLAAIVILAILLGMLLGALSSVSSIYLESEEKIQAAESGRAALELIARELTPAVVDTRMQFAVVPGSVLEDRGAVHIAPQSPALLWMAPLGKNGDLRCVGYYLTAEPDRRRFRLKRIYLRDDNPYGYFPRLVNKEDARDLTMRTNARTADWFTENWEADTFDDRSAGNEKVAVSTVLDRVVAFWVQPLDLLGNPIPWVSQSDHHPDSELIFNSAAYFQMADVTAFEEGKSFVYLADRPLVMKAHRIPPEVEIAIVTLREVVLNREIEIPEMINRMHGNGSLDLQGSLDAFLALLKEEGIEDAEAFSTRVKLTNGG